MVKLPIISSMLAFVGKAGDRKGIRTPLTREERLKIGFDQAPLGIGMASLDGHWFQINDRFRSILGYSREELARISFHSITHPEDARKESSLVKRLLAGEVEFFRMEKRVFEKKGQYHPIEVLTSLVRGIEGEPEFFVYIIDDHKGLNRHDAARDAEKMIGSIVDDLSEVAIIRTDERGTITGWNMGAQRIFGYGREEIIGKNRRMLYRDADSWEGKSTAQLTNASDSGKIDFEDFRVARDGTQLWIHTSISAMKPDGVLKGYVEVISTISVDSRKAVEQLRASNQLRSAEMQRTIDGLRLEAEKERRIAESLRSAVSDVRRTGEETMNELKIMAAALRKELDRRKVVEEELRLAHERIAEMTSVPLVVPALPEPIAVEEEIVTEIPDREWRSLDGMSPAELLISHASDQRTGTLVLANGSHEREIFLDEGKIISCASNQPSQFLAQYLVRLGYITDEQRQRALEIKQETHLALGRILLLLGAITEEQLVTVIRSKMEDEVTEVFDWKDARWCFAEADVKPMQLVPLHLEVAPLVVKRLSARANEAARPIPGPVAVPFTAPPLPAVDVVPTITDSGSDPSIGWESPDLPVTPAFPPAFPLVQPAAPSRFTPQIPLQGMEPLLDSPLKFVHPQKEVPDTSDAAALALMDGEVEAAAAVRSDFATVSAEALAGAMRPARAAMGSDRSDDLIAQLSVSPVVDMVSPPPPAVPVAHPPAARRGAARAPRASKGKAPAKRESLLHDAGTSTPAPRIRPVARETAQHPTLVASSTGRSKKYHHSTCSMAARIDEESRVTFASEAQARKSGYEACRLCSK